MRTALLQEESPRRERSSKRSNGTNTLWAKTLYGTKPLNGAWSLIGICVLVAVWAFLTSPSLNINPMAASFSPTKALPELAHALVQERVWTHIAASLKRIGVGLFMACIVGIPFGIALGRIPWLERASLVPIQFMRMISPLSWMPIAVMMLGIGDVPIYFLLTVAAVWPLMLNTAEGVKRVDRHWIEMSQSLGANSFETLRWIIIPAIRGHVLTGFRLGLGVAWIVLVPAEMLGVRSGLGYAILDARDRLAYPELMAMILLIGCIGWLMDGLARSVEHKQRRISPQHLKTS